MTENNCKGKAFEKKVHEVLSKVEDKHPDLFNVYYQPKFRLHDAQEVIPDFEIRIHLLFAECRYLIECQDRKRSSSSIVHKIKSMKLLSSRNKFIFVHAKSLSESTRSALDADGVIRMSFDDFITFAKQIDLQLTRQSKPNVIGRGILSISESEIRGGSKEYQAYGITKKIKPVC